MGARFIHVQGETNKNKLVAAGFKLVTVTRCMGDNIYTFLDDDRLSKAVFSEVKLVSNNKLIFA